MKFRARMVEMVAMKKFYNILQSITKLTKLCVMRMTENKVYFIASEPLGSGHLPIGGPSIWCEMEQANFFNEYKLEGVSADQVILKPIFLNQSRMWARFSVHAWFLGPDEVLGWKNYCMGC